MLILELAGRRDKQRWGIFVEAGLSGVLLFKKIGPQPIVLDILLKILDLFLFKPDNWMLPALKKVGCGVARGNLWASEAAWIFWMIQKRLPWCRLQPSSGSTVVLGGAWKVNLQGLKFIFLGKGTRKRHFPWFFRRSLDGGVLFVSVQI